MARITKISGHLSSSRMFLDMTPSETWRVLKLEFQNYHITLSKDHCTLLDKGGCGWEILSNSGGLWLLDLHSRSHLMLTQSPAHIVPCSPSNKRESMISTVWQVVSNSGGLWLLDLQWGILIPPQQAQISCDQMNHSRLAARYKATSHIPTKTSLSMRSGSCNKHWALSCSRWRRFSPSPTITEEIVTRWPRTQQSPHPNCSCRWPRTCSSIWARKRRVSFFGLIYLHTNG